MQMLTRTNCKEIINKSTVLSPNARTFCLVRNPKKTRKLYVTALLCAIIISKKISLQSAISTLTWSSRCCTYSYLCCRRWYVCLESLITMHCSAKKINEFSQRLWAKRINNILPCTVIIIYSPPWSHLHVAGERAEAVPAALCKVNAPSIKPYCPWVLMTSTSD